MEIKRSNFTFPTKEDVVNIKVEYPNLQKINIPNIDEDSDKNTKCFSLQEFLQLEDNCVYKKKRVYIEEFQNILRINHLYLTNLLYYASTNPDRFKLGEESANSFLYEMYYEMVYSKLSSSFDRFLHLINIYYNLETPGLITKRNIEKEYNKNRSDIEKIELKTIIDNYCKLGIGTIRNKFTHNELIFEPHIKQISDQGFKDAFPYKKEAEQALDHFLKLIEFYEKEAIPFLYKAKKT